MEARFPFSGKVVNVQKFVGEKVAQWELIASLDRKQLQTELDRQLADYERVRAEFDLFNSQSKGQDDTAKFLRVQKQAALNASVKDVELAKAKLDQADLFSPVEGVIVAADNLAAGIYVSPANSAVKILDTNSLVFTFLISQEQVEFFTKSREVKIGFKGKKDKLSTKTNPFFFGANGKFEVICPLLKDETLLAGMTGEAKLE